MKIKTKLLLLAAGVISIIVVLVSVFYVKGQNVLMEQVNIVGFSSSKDGGEFVDLYFIGLENIIANASPSVAMVMDGDEDDLQKETILENYLAQMQRSNVKNNVMAFYFGMEDSGKTPNIDVPEGYDPRQRGWYIAAKGAGSLIITDVYIDAVTGKSVITIAAPVKSLTSGNKFHGVLAIDVDLAILKTLTEEIKVMGKGYSFLVNSKGLVMTHPDDAMFNVDLTRSNERIHPSLTAVAQKMITRQTSYGDYRFDGTERRVYYSPTKSGPIFGVVFPQKEISNIVARISTPTAILGIVSIISVLIVVILIIPSIVRPMAGVAEILESISKLDLTTHPSASRFDKVSGKNTEVGIMLRSLSTLRESLTETIRTLALESKNTHSTLTRLTQLSEENDSAVREIKSALSNVNNNADSSMATLIEAEKSVKEVSSASTLTANAAVLGAEASSKTSSISNDAVKSVHAVVAELSSTGTKAQSSVVAIQKVSDSVTSIAGFVNTIRRIADQTNLLALNAAIEAARAGDAGRGFAVVADEVRNLAEESNTAARNVADLIESLHNNTSESIRATLEGGELLKGTIDKAIETKEQLSKALEEIARVNDSMQSIAAAAEEQAAASYEVSSSIGSMTVASGNMLKNVSRIAESVDKTAQVSDSLNEEAHVLAQGVERLEELIEAFTLDAKEIVHSKTSTPPALAKPRPSSTKTRP